MDITPYVESLRHDLAAAAEAGGTEARQAAERLALALDPAMRMALMDALTQAAAEITADLPVGSVDVRLRGREPQFVVDVPTQPIAASAAPSGPSAPRPSGGDAEDEQPEEDDTIARITLRIPESLKFRAEELAAKGGHSLNSWIVNVLRVATRERAINVDIDLSSIPFLDVATGFAGNQGRPGRSSKKMTGWI
ncbi:MAG TPA: toxin-antitoxin system HicB family antitoxin [Nocardioidaceae bacterium]|nr:toxin-antitoxin system HicB family antitoxin [Nocardioidaceae bacterium]